jgi:molybdenum cofactor synthesis domain-containing protein
MTSNPDAHHTNSAWANAHSGASSLEAQLLDKTEMKIEPIDLSGANLTDIENVVADTLELPRDDVIVIDARDRLLALDILSATVDPSHIAGKQHELITALGQLPGVAVTERTAIGSQGVLGWIAADRSQAMDWLDRAATMSGDIHRAIARRALVLSTGPEIVGGQVEDTNKPWIIRRLQEAGYSATPGANLPDLPEHIASVIREAGTELGYGLVITTGGIGAENKDTTVEALLELDPSAVTPVLFHVAAGHGRHVKDAVRIAVGRVGTATVVCLPGPHAQATLGVQTLLSDPDLIEKPEVLADRLATALRATLRGHR